MILMRNQCSIYTTLIHTTSFECSMFLFSSNVFCDFFTHTKIQGCQQCVLWTNGWTRAGLQSRWTITKVSSQGINPKNLGKKHVLHWLKEKNDALLIIGETGNVSLSQQEGARSCDPFWRPKQPLLGFGRGGEAWPQNTDYLVLQISPSN